MAGDPRSDELQDVELAFARLAWAQASGGVQLPSQLDAMNWHVSCCRAALAALEHRASGRAGRA